MQHWGGVRFRRDRKLGLAAASGVSRGLGQKEQVWGVEFVSRSKCKGPGALAQVGERRAQEGGDVLYPQARPGCRKRHGCWSSLPHAALSVKQWQPQALQGCLWERQPSWSGNYQKT